MSQAASSPNIPALAALVTSLAPPVARGLLPRNHAIAAVALAMLRHKIEPDFMAHEMRIWTHILDQHTEMHALRRNVIRARIWRTLRPLIALHLPWGRLMAEAHDVNADMGGAMREWDVTDVVREQVWHALPSAPFVRRPHHGR